MEKTRRPCSPNAKWVCPSRFHFLSFALWTHVSHRPLWKKIAQVGCTLNGHLYSSKISFPSCFRIRSYSNFFLLEILGPQMSILWDVRGGGVDQLIEQWDLFADKMNTKVQRLCFFTAVNSSGELLYCYDRSWHLISYHVIWDWSSVPFKRFKTGTDTRSWHCLKLCIMSKIFQGEGAKKCFLGI